MKNVISKLLTAVLVAGCVSHVYAQSDVTDTLATAEASATATQLPETTVTNMPAASGEQLAQLGDSAYAADNFVLAEQFYNEAMKTGGSSALLFYNLGNTYYRQGNLGKAIVNYERSLKLDPTNADARDNLAFVKSKITDRQIDEGSIMTTLWNNITGMLTANAWAWIAVVLFALFLGSLAIYLFSSVVVIKKISFFGGIIVFLLCATSVTVALSAADRIENNTRAIILSPAAQLSTSPREARTRSEEAFLLHEGTNVEIVDSVSTGTDGKWYEVKVGTGDRAWIKASDIERI